MGMIEKSFVSVDDAELTDAYPEQSQGPLIVSVRLSAVSSGSAAEAGTVPASRSLPMGLSSPTTMLSKMRRPSGSKRLKG